jgi:hypothetical protein
MSRCDEFRQYAEEAMRWAGRSKTESDKAILLDIARTWTQAALYRERVVVANHSPPQEPSAVLRV